LAAKPLAIEEKKRKAEIVDFGIKMGIARHKKGYNSIQ
jgi:hypothetical protein